MRLGKILEIEKYLNKLLKVEGQLDTSGDNPSYTFKTPKGVEIKLYMWEHNDKTFINDLIVGGEYYEDAIFDVRIQEIISDKEKWVEIQEKQIDNNFEPNNYGYNYSK